jgi:hypothetical protein
MIIRIREIAILQAGMRDDCCNVAVAQVRQVEGRAVVREGCVALIFHTKDGKQVDVLATPEEARELGVLGIACAFTAAGAPPPTVNMTPPGGGPVQTGRA